MHEPIEQREALWDSFLQRWPLEQLPSMTLPAYNQAGADDSFCRWLEKHLESLGSIWGGSSLKFGIYSRANTEKDPSGQNGVTANGSYAWYSRYGQSEEVAFARVRDLIVATAQAARGGRLTDIESIDLWPILKWKIAFLYQNRQQPTVLPIYLRKYLAAALTGQVPTLHAELYRVLLAERGNQPLLAYADAVYERGQVALQHQQRVAVLEHFAGAADLAPRLQAANATLAFCDLALALHEQGLDWWITKDGELHAGRTEDFRVWQVALGLRVEVGADLTRVCVPGEGGEHWQVLEEALVDSLIETVARLSVKWPKPVRAAYWPDDYDNMADRLVITLTDGAIRNGYLSVPKSQRLFPEACLGDSEQPAARLFTLRLPDGSSEQTQVLKQYKRIQARFNGFFTAEGLQAGDQVVLSKVAEFDYQLSVRRAGQKDDAAMPQAKDTSKETLMRSVPLNQILFGPPGTGKTYATIGAALQVLDPDYLQTQRDNRAVLKQRFDELVLQDRIRFVTFHQSFSYEDFVEGLRATTDEATGQLRYEVVDGVFKQMCYPEFLVSSELNDRERIHVRRVISFRLGAQGQNEAKIAAIIKDERVLFDRQDVERGDMVLLSDGIQWLRAVGVVLGTCPPEEGLQSGQLEAQMRWLKLFEPAVALGEVVSNPSAVHREYFLKPDRVRLDALQRLVSDSSATEGKAEEIKPKVLIIDEINRGNISRIFGELITLIESSKRAGADEALSVVLPYSKQPFSVPSNLYLIGTMNTADRSLAGLDIALRRRFVFREMPPQPELLNGVMVEQAIDIGQLLRVMNQRIEVLLDRDHCLGHAYFMPLKGDASLARLAVIFQSQILPLLQEYFFEDWERISWVLNDQQAESKGTEPFIRRPHSEQSLVALFGSQIAEKLSDQRWELNDKAFRSLDSYLNILG